MALSAVFGILIMPARGIGFLHFRGHICVGDAPLRVPRIIAAVAATKVKVATYAVAWHILFGHVVRACTGFNKCIAFGDA